MKQHDTQVSVFVHGIWNEITTDWAYRHSLRQIYIFRDTGVWCA